MAQTETAGEISQRILADTTKYDALEVGYAITENEIEKWREVRTNHNPIIMEDEYCIVCQLCDDQLISPRKGRKYYADIYLPEPRPNQYVVLYNKKTDTFEKLLWCLPCAMVMAELSELLIVHKRYKRMQAWSIAFFKGTFWEYIRYEHKIDILSEKEYENLHREELRKASGKNFKPRRADPFDFSKIAIKKAIDSVTPALKQNILQ